MTRDKLGLREVVPALAVVVPFFISARREMNAAVMGIGSIDYVALSLGFVAIGFALANITFHNTSLYKNINIVFLLGGIFHVARGFGLLSGIGI